MKKYLDTLSADLGAAVQAGNMAEVVRLSLLLQKVAAAIEAGTDAGSQYGRYLITYIESGAD